VAAARSIRLGSRCSDCLVGGACRDVAGPIADRGPRRARLRRARGSGGGGGNRTRVRKPYIPGPTCLASSLILVARYPSGRGEARPAQGSFSEFGPQHTRLSSL